MDISEEEWLTTGQAAKAAGRDIRTIRRWVDEGRLKARVSPGGHRQIALSSLLEVQRPARSRPRRGRRGRGVASPLDCLGNWSETTLDWGGWQPPASATAATLRELLDDIDDVRRALETLRPVVVDAIADASEGGDALAWLRNLPTRHGDESSARDTGPLRPGGGGEGC